MANFDVTTEYAQSTSDTTAPTSGWSTTKPAPSEGYFVWARNIMNMGYGDIISEPYCIGDGLEHILSIDVEYIAWSDAYQSPPQSSEYWQTTAPSIQAGQYIWTRTKMVTTYGTNYTDPLRVTGIDGQDGTDGQDGISIKGDDGKGFDFIYYTTDSATFNITPTDDVVRTQNQYDRWCDSPTPVDATHQYIYMSLRTTDSNGDWGHWSSPVLMSSIGEKGEDGEGFEIIFTRTNSDSTVPTFSNGQGSSSYTGTDSQGRHYQDADFTPTGWTDNQQGVDSNHKYEWASFRFKTVTNGEASWGNFNTPKIWATFSEDGESSYIHIRYSSVNNPSDVSQTTTSPTSTTVYIGICVSNSSGEPSFNCYSWKKWIPEEGIDYDGKFLHMKYASDVTFNQDGSVNTVTFTGNNGEDAGEWLGTLFDYTVTDSTNGADYTWTKIEGNGISNIQEQYAMSTSYTTAPTTGWGNSPLENEVGKFYWTRNVISFTDGTTTTTNAICVSGADGDGVHNAYYCTDSLSTPNTPSFSDIHANSSTASQNYDKWVEDPVAIDSTHRYIYISTSTSYSYVSGVKVWNSFSEPVLWSRYALDGSDGVDGTNGTNGIGYEYAYYTSDSSTAPTKPSGNVTATSGTKKWTTVPIPMTSTYKYMYISYRTVQGSTKSTWSDSALWSQFGEKGDTGASGKDGLGMEHIFYLTNTEITDWDSVTGDTNPTNWTTQPSTDDYVKSSTGWSDDATGVDSTHKYEYCSIRRKEYDTDGKTAKWGAFSTPSLWAKFGADGKSITRVVNYYVASDSGSTAPSTGWKTDISQVTDFGSTKRYLWNKERSYSGNAESDFVSESNAVVIAYWTEDGHAGKGISSVVEHYAVSSSNSTAPSSWQSTNDANFTMPVTTSTNKYLWNYETLNFTDGSHHDTTKRIIGTHGETGASIVFAYYTSDNANYSGSPSGSLATGNNKGNNKWCDTPYPTSASYPYLYVSTKTTETGSTWSSASLMSKYGLDGNHGTGYEYAYYTTATSPSRNPTSNEPLTTGVIDSWQKSPVAITDTATKIYISYRTKVEGQTPSSWSNYALFSIKGDTGNNGYSITRVVNYYAVSTSETAPQKTASNTWSTSMPNNFNATNKYLWNYEKCYKGDNDSTDFVSETNPVIIGTYSQDGKGITSITEKYAKSSSSTNAPDSWDTSIPVLDATNKYMWNQTTISYTKGADSVNERVIGVRGENGYDGVGFEMVFKLMDSENPTWNNNNNPHTISTSATGFQSAGYIPFSSSSTNKWTNDPSGVSSSHKYEFASVRTSDENGDWGAFSQPSLFSKYGEDGISVEYIYRVNNSTTAPTFVTENNKSQQNNDYTGTVNNKHFYDDDFVPTGWSDDPVSVSENNKYCWVCERRKVNGSWESFGNPSIWARYGEDGAKGDEGERGTRIIEITKAPSYNSSGWHDDAMGVGVYYYYRKEIKYVLSESGETEVKVGDYLKYDTTLYLVDYMNNYWVCLVETELAPDMENIDASLLNGKESSEFMTSIPDIESISQTGGGAVECWKFGQLIITQVRGCVVTNTGTNTGWETLKSSNTDITLPSTYRPANTIIVGCGTQSGNNTKDMQLKLNSNSGTLQFKRAGFLNGANGDSETVDATFVYFNDTRTATTLTDTKNYNESTYGACIGDSLEVQLKTGNTVMSGYPVIFTINGVNYQRTTDSNGKASLKLNLAKNNSTGYNWSAKYNGNNTYKSCSVGQSNMKLFACGGHIELDYLSAIYPHTPFSGTIYNSHGNPVKDVVVTVTVANTVSFSSTTNENGRFFIFHPNDGIVYNTTWNCVFTVDTNRVATLNETYNGQQYPTSKNYVFTSY